LYLLKVKGNTAQRLCGIAQALRLEDTYTLEPVLYLFCSVQDRLL
jgi:hypothetical protein